MEVVIDTSCLQVSQAGIPRYTRGVLRGLSEARQSDDTVRTIQFGVPNHNYAQPKRALVTALREGVWGPISAPLDLQRMKVDLLHSPDLPIIRTSKIPHVVTLHDLAVLQTPERYRPWQRWSGARRMKALRKRDRVICISRFTASLAMRELGLSHRQIEVIPNGCNYADLENPPALKPQSDATESDYFLFVGSLEPGKNLRLLIQTWELARRFRVDLPPLVIVGARRQGVPAEDAPPANWHYLGHVADSELVHLYQNARAILFPSTYEGWGLPIVEAMALGCPVVASPLTAIPEAAGDAALLIDQQPASWLEATRALLQDENRLPLIERGQRHARQFTWKRMGNALWQTYQDVLDQRGGSPVGVTAPTISQPAAG